MTALARPLAALVRALVRSAAAVDDVRPRSSSTRCSSPARVSSETSSCASRSATPGPRQDPVDVGGVLAGQRAQLALPCQLGLQSACVAGQFGQIVAEFGGHVADHRQRLRRAVRPAPAVRRRRCPPAPTWPARLRRPPSGIGVGGSSSAPESAVVRIWAASRSASSSDNRRMSATSASSSPGCGCDSVDFVEPELQPVGLLRQFPCPLRAVGEVAARRQPRRRAACGSAPAASTDVGEAVQRGALLVGRASAAADRSGRAGLAARW